MYFCLCLKFVGNFVADAVFTSEFSDASKGLPVSILKCQISQIWNFKGT